MQQVRLAGLVYFGYHRQCSFLFTIFLKMYLYHWLCRLYLQSGVLLIDFFFFKGFSEDNCEVSDVFLWSPVLCLGQQWQLQCPSLPRLPLTSMADIRHLSRSSFQLGIILHSELQAATAELAQEVEIISHPCLGSSVSDRQHGRAQEHSRTIDAVK